MRPAPYSTDLTNREWAVLRPLLPPAKTGFMRFHRKILQGGARLQGLDSPSQKNQ